MMTELDEQLREHYASFERGHGMLREQLLDEIRSEDVRTVKTSKLFNRRLLMRLSAAAVVAFAIGITVFLINPGSQGTTWAEVVKAIGPIESLQYRTVNQVQNEQRRTTQNYVTPTEIRVDEFLTETDGLFGGAKPPGEPNSIHISRSSGRETTDYSVMLENGRPTSIVQHVGYSILADAARDAANPRDGRQVLQTWRRLQGMPPEAVLKRGSQEVDGQRLLRFEVIDAVNLPGLEGFQSGTFILVDARTKQPVVLEAGSTRWTDIRFNETISEERFAPPSVPDDLDPEVTWEFVLPADVWNKKGFVFRVLDAKGEPIVTKDDVETVSMGQAESQGGFGAAPGARVVLGAEELSMQGWLSQAGVQKLDRFMARNPGAEMTIEITGEPPIKRTVYGRLSRRLPMGHAGGAVRFGIFSQAQIKAATQPIAPEGVEIEGPGGGGLPGAPGRGFRPAGGRR
jgi:hypothetical protein